ncbi:MAG TPA: hypothetical protein VK157_03985 [Phycisphaerales bacterium]|nr:hypothetical protein [Phycisphaerales bacterium]
MFPRSVIRLFRLATLAACALWIAVAALCVQMSPAPEPVLAAVVFGWMLPLGLWIALRLYYRRIRAYVREMDFLVCPKCGYDLHGCDSFGSCPECGRPYARDKLALDWHRGGFAPRELLSKFYRKRR